MPEAAWYLASPWLMELLAICSEPLLPNRAGGKRFFAIVRRDLSVWPGEVADGEHTGVTPLLSLLGPASVCGCPWESHSISQTFKVDS